MLFILKYKTLWYLYLKGKFSLWLFFLFPWFKPIKTVISYLIRFIWVLLTSFSDNIKIMIYKSFHYRLNRRTQQNTYHKYILPFKVEDNNPINCKKCYTRFAIKLLINLSFILRLQKVILFLQWLKHFH